MLLLGSPMGAALVAALGRLMGDTDTASNLWNTVQVRGPPTHTPARLYRFVISLGSGGDGGDGRLETMFGCHGKVLAHT